MEGGNPGGNPEVPDILPVFPTCCAMEVLGLEPTFIHNYTKIYHTTTNNLTDTTLHTGTLVSQSTCYCFPHMGRPRPVQPVVTLIITAAAIMIANT